MIGAHDFCSHYEWTFAYILREHGEEALRRYWEEAIGFDSQGHAARLIREKGIQGMIEYWSHSLTMEEAGYALSATDDAFRIDMHDCPSKGYLIGIGQEAFPDYCAHCMGWIGPVAEAAGFSVDHEHNHLGQCWWEMRRQGTPPGREALAREVGDKAVENHPRWAGGRHDHYRDGKLVEPEENKQQ